MLGGSGSVVPYCGAPPLPDTLWMRWNLDPVLLMALLAIGCAYALGATGLNRKFCVLPRGRQAAFYAGWAVTTACLVSPLCPLSVSLFAARVGQHMILALIAAPLVAAGRPVAAISFLWRTSGGVARCYPERSTWTAAPLAAAGLFAALLWFWHSPAAYGATFTSTAAYWSMHVSMFAASVWLWSELLDRNPARVVAATGAGVISSAQMGLLGALITLAPRPLYAPHALTIAAWNLTPLQDQQLGGAIMWVPGGVVFLAVAMVMLWLTIARAPSPLIFATRSSSPLPGIATP